LKTKISVLYALMAMGVGLVSSIADGPLPVGIYEWEDLCIY